jgi:hypothetical protein
MITLDDEPVNSVILMFWSVTQYGVLVVYVAETYKAFLAEPLDGCINFSVYCSASLTR